MKTSAVENDVTTSPTTSSIIIEERQSKSHRANSLGIPHTAYYIDSHQPSDVNFQPRKSLGIVPLMEKSVQDRDLLMIWSAYYYCNRIHHFSWVCCRDSCHGPGQGLLDKRRI